MDLPLDIRTDPRLWIVIGLLYDNRLKEHGYNQTGRQSSKGLRHFL
jgi:hypothetical protein